MGAKVAYIPRAEEAERVAAWARIVLSDEEQADTLTFACAGDADGCADALADLDVDPTTVVPLAGPQPWRALVDHARDLGTDTVIAKPGGDWGGDVAAIERMMRETPCQTFLDLGGATAPADVRRVLVLTFGSAHDATLVRAGCRIARVNDGSVTIAAIEADVGPGAAKLGERAIQELLHVAEADEDPRVEARVVVDDHPVRAITTCFDDHDLVIVGLNDLHLMRNVLKTLGDASIAVVKRTPPLRTRTRAAWIPQVNPSDYAELLQQLRQGSRWNADFVIMLGLAAAVASLGLMQNSPAVVIGSMLLAPLMTPMIGFGMALLQANRRLGAAAGKAIGLGALLTVCVSMGLGFFDPGDTLSPEVLSRGSPNLLDLGIALFAAMAAGYALARPTIAGAVAGVAIATALVPPLCACGISLAAGIKERLGEGTRWGVEAYEGAFLNAMGAAILFLTNLIAIVLASMFIFSLMGVTVPRTFTRARRMRRAVFIAFVVALLLLCVPLGIYLDRQMDEGRAQPLGYPVSRAVAEAVHAYTDNDPEVRPMLMGRSPSSPMIVIHLASRRSLEASYIEGLRARVRDVVNDPEFDVVIIAVRWVDEGGKDDR